MTEESFCIDKGTNIVPSGIDISFDLDGEERLSSNSDFEKIDIGADDYRTVLFVRGDANDDITINIADAIFINNYLFAGGDAPECMDAANANDDDAVDLSDSISILLFISGDKLIPPPCQSYQDDEENLIYIPWYSPLAVQLRIGCNCYEDICLPDP